MVKQYSRCRHILIGSFSIDDGDGSENATLKMNSPFLETLSSLFQFAENVKCRQISLELISWRPHSSLERERKICRRLFAYSIKREITKEQKEQNPCKIYCALK